MESSSPTRLSRLTAIITMLQSRRLLTAGDIAERFQISRRTAYRDLKALEEAGIPLYVEEGKGYALVDGFSLPPMMFSQEEANALITAEKMVAQNADASFVQHFQQAMTKIRAVFSAEAQDRTELLEERIVFRQNQAPEGPSQSLATIQTAIADFRVLRIAYQKTPAEAAETRKIEPL
ncbi:MAG: HTH domain-containing protein, partial [Bacteroidota bacterium]